jgi:dolichol-phosphate mannosyltransferase
VKELLIAIPVINERKNLEKLIPDLLVYLCSRGGILVIDDNSNDGTEEFIKTIKLNNKNIHYIRNPKKVGLGNAYKMAAEFAIKNEYTWLQQMDADLSHRVEDLNKFDEAEPNSDMIIGSRYVKEGKILNWPLKRRIISLGGSLYAKIILGCKTNDLTGGFNRTKTEVLKKINFHEIKSRGYAFQIELKYRAYKKGYKLTEVPITFSDRVDGKTKMNRSIILEAIWKVWWMRFMISNSKRK